LPELRITSKKNIWPQDWRKKTSIMGIINLTPDSFSDGGEFDSIDKALDQVRRFSLSGADIIDLGAQSTRPGADEIGVIKEIERLIPILKAIRYKYPEILISVDTFNSEVAYQALLNGADWINDVTGGRRDKEILDVVAKFNCPFVITHSKGNSKNMNKLMVYDNLFLDIVGDLKNHTEEALSRNIKEEKIIWDPGLGFSKNTSQNIKILQNLEIFQSFGFPILIGASRKRFIGEILDEEIPKNRDIGTLAVSCLCSQKKIDIVRVHNVEINYQVLKLSDKINR
tara:strand:+ start:1836 stop:2687 length:852 start_codon:yes stop_codon:yes gene_type:complete